MKDKIEKCPTCDANSNFIPPTQTDKKRRKLIVTYQCSNGHLFTIEKDIK